jgi:hypothetical protein
MRLTSQHKWIAIGCAAILVLAFATNPDQATHLKAIKDTAALTSSQPYTAASDFTAAMSYNNYVVFSTTTLAGSVVSWGAFGRVQTTNRVSDPFGIKSK